MEKINHLSVFYASNEYTTQIGNLEMARRYASDPSYRPMQPLLVHTIEHGGWSMTHYFDAKFPEGLCVGTANDRAKFQPEEERVRELIFTAERNTLPDVRRTTEDAITDATQALYSLGLSKTPQGVLRPGAAKEMYEGTFQKEEGNEYVGLDLSNNDVKMALLRFYLVCQRIGAMERKI